MIYLDTHVVAWIYASGVELLSPTVMERIDASQEVRISPMAHGSPTGHSARRSP